MKESNIGSKIKLKVFLKDNRASLELAFDSLIETLKTNQQILYNCYYSDDYKKAVIIQLTENFYKNLVKDLVDDAIDNVAFRTLPSISSHSSLPFYSRGLPAKTLKNAKEEEQSVTYDADEDGFAR